MSVIGYRCDRCGNEFSQGGLGFQHYPVLTDTTQARTTYYGHFCPRCKDEFDRFMAQGGVE